MFYDRKMFDNYDIADEVLKNYRLIERRGPDLHPIK